MTARPQVSVPDPSDDVPDEMTLDAYYASFQGSLPDNPLASAALANALDIRKFEIGLYWTRAGYFWAFIAVAFAGYFAMFVELKDEKSDVLFAINCLGLVFSTAWYLVNRGNKYWQLNWEEHVDLLEDKVTGPLYKTVLHPDRFSLLDDGLLGPYPFSVSKINTILSLFVVFVWGVLAIRTLWIAFGGPKVGPEVSLVSLFVAAVVGMGILIDKGRTGDRRPECEESDSRAAALRKRRATHRFKRRPVPRQSPREASLLPAHQHDPRAET